MPCSPGPGEEMVTLQPVIRTMDESDPETISAAFTALGWRRAALYQRYLAEQGKAGGSPSSPNGAAGPPAT